MFDLLPRTWAVFLVSFLSPPPLEPPFPPLKVFCTLSAQERLCAVEMAVGLSGTSVSPLTQLERRYAWGHSVLVSTLAGSLCSFVRGISYLGDALYIFVMTLLKTKQNWLCASSQRPLRFHFLLEGWSPKTTGESGCTRQPSLGQKPHAHLLSLLCSWEHPKGRVGLSSTLGLSNRLGELVQQFKVSAQKHRLCMT